MSKHYYLRTCRADGSSPSPMSNGFRWPLTIGAHAAWWRDRDNLDATASILAGALLVLWGVYVAVLP